LEQYVELADQWLTLALQTAGEWATSPQFYAQLSAIATALVLATLVSRILRSWVTVLREPPSDGHLPHFRAFLYSLRELVLPALNILLLGVAIEVTNSAVGQSWLVTLAQGLAVVFLLYSMIRRFIPSTGMQSIAKWIGIPIATLRVFGWLDPVIEYLDDIALSLGDIHVSLYAVLRTLIVGSVLFWAGRVSSNAGKQAIRSQQTLDIGTREVFAKLFEIGLFVIIFLLLLQVMGISLTALAVFGGALGVGLGFGLQQIASNFISGIIILIDRSIAIGDYIELEDGRAGNLRELNMRFGVIETFDGKDIMVPNELFITTSYTNWTHKDPNQRYSLEFQVAYSTDLDLLFDNIRRICTDHPSVISDETLGVEYLPDAEIAGFGESGIDVLVEFWMHGIDEGKNRVGADLLLSIWRSIKEHGMEIPFPQREVRILKD
jgi:small-conductance mechanosensitive channel